MLICAISVLQNQQTILLPTTNHNNMPKPSATLQGNIFNESNNKLYETWEYLTESHAIFKNLNIFLDRNKPVESISNNYKFYNSLLLRYKEKTGQLHYFNTNNHPSDTVGDLKGNVYYAQSSIIPAGNHIDGDIHPNLVAERKTLVIFKPHEKIENNEDIELKIYNKNDKEIHSTKLRSPSLLPRVAGSEINFTSLTPECFTIPDTLDLRINSSEKINQLVNDDSYLNKLLYANNRIKIDIQEKNPPFRLSLDNLVNHPNKKIVFNIIGDIDAKIQYNKKSIALPSNQSFVMVSDNEGNWFSRDESRLSQHYKHLLNNYNRNIIPTNFDITIDTNENINKLSKDKSYFDELIRKNNSIKISTGDGYWERNFNLSNGEQYANKKIYFTSEATYDSYINYGDKNIKISTHGSQLFISDKNGNWSIADPIAKNNTDFSKPKLFDITIDTNSEILKISKDIDYLNKIIIENDNINISTCDGNWSKDFTLESNPRFANKKIYFSSSASYDSQIFYGDNKVTIKKNQSKLFVADELGFWRTYENEPLTVDEIQYIENGWSVAIPKDYIHPGIKFTFSYNNKQGSLSTIKIGPPTSLLLHTINIGMLTPYQGEFPFQNNPELQRQFLQQIPVSKLTVSQYRPVQLNKAALSDGTHYTVESADNGDGHNGDMREQIAKDLISDGINSANYGPNSSAPYQNNFLPTSQIVIHYAIGNYINGIQQHGWSGGAGKITLSSSVGNEISHELGHNFGVGDYHNGFNGGVHAQADQKNSTWGWDADNDFFNPNFEKETNNKLTYLNSNNNVEQPAASPYKKHSMSKDAMSDGNPYNPSYNAYTQYTPATLHNIQQYLEGNCQFSVDSTSGYIKKNSETQQMESYPLTLDIKQIKSSLNVEEHSDITQDKLSNLLSENDFLKINIHKKDSFKNIYLPKANEENKHKTIKIVKNSIHDTTIHLNKESYNIDNGEEFYYQSNGHFWEEFTSISYIKKPYKHGVLVVTLVGFYDPKNQLQHFIAPALEGSYGMVYNSDAPSDKGTFLRVTLANGETKDYSLHQHRLVDGKMNKFHINIERKLNPIKTELFIKGSSVASKEIKLSDKILHTTINGIPQ